MTANTCRFYYELRPYHMASNLLYTFAIIDKTYMTVLLTFIDDASRSVYPLILLSLSKFCFL